MSVIGDTQAKAVQPVVSALPISVVAEAAIVDKDNAVNIALYSGKKEGACYIMKETTGGELVMIVAAGSAPTDVWYRQDDMTAEITPA